MSQSTTSTSINHFYLEEVGPSAYGLVQLEVRVRVGVQSGVQSAGSRLLRCHGVADVVAVTFLAVAAAVRVLDALLELAG
jgi:hypothetical protein